MDFGKNLLKKYGWNEGDGLGKNSDGITKPLKANLKFDKAGLGESRSKEFNNPWWERAYNDAAKNLDVRKDGENVSIDVKDKNSVEITTKTHSSKNLRKTASQNGYNNFIKKSVLSGSRETHEKSSDSEPEEPDLPKYKTLTDEQLFAACGGLTAHKGARHGLKLSGKLSRVKEQEQELLAKFKLAEQSLCNNSWTLVASKKHKYRPEPKDDVVVANSEKCLEQHLYTNEYHVKSNKKKKKNKKDDEELSLAVHSAFGSADGDVIPKKRKKPKKETVDESTQTWISESALQKLAKKDNFSKIIFRDLLEDKKKKKLKKFVNKSTMV